MRDHGGDHAADAVGASDRHDAPPADVVDDAAPSAGVDGAAAQQEVRSPPTPAPACVGDRDGVIEPGELRADPDDGVAARFVVNRAGTEAAVAPAGQWRDGTLRWDFRVADAARDEEVVERLSVPSAHWFGGHFAGADFVQPFDAAGSTLAIFGLDPIAGLSLWGTADAAPPAEGGGDWLRYATPVALLPLPLRQGDAWTSGEVEASGRADGTDYPADFGPAGVVRLVHRYDLAVDQAGIASLPIGDVAALRIHVALQTEARNDLLLTPVATQSVRIHLYVSECLGLVARIRSRPDEPATDFARATEYRRLGPLAAP